MITLGEIIRKQKEDDYEYKVAVLITCYNQIKYISKAIDSVLHQKTSFPFLIIIEDDCSTDGSTDILEQYEKRYPDKIKVIYNPNNLGMVENRNALVNNCQTPYVAILDGDDYFIDDDQLQRKYDFLEKNDDYIAYFTGGKTCTNGEIAQKSDFEINNCYYPFGKEDAIYNKYPGLIDGFFYRYIFKYGPQEITQYCSEAIMDHSSKLPIILGMIGDIYRNDKISTFVYMDVPGSDSKTSSCKRYYTYRISLVNSKRLI